MPEGILPLLILPALFAADRIWAWYQDRCVRAELDAVLYLATQERYPEQS